MADNFIFLPPEGGGGGGGITELTGDVTATGPGSAAATLSSTAVSPNTYGAADKVGTFTVDQKGRLTSAADVSISITQSQVTNLVTDLAAKQPIFNPAASVYFFDDFISQQAPAALGWNAVSNGTGATDVTSVGGATTVGAMGVNSYETGTTATGRTCSNLGLNSLIFGQGAVSYSWRVRVNTLSDGTNRYNLYAGTGDKTAAGDMVDGVYFQYVDNVNSGNWTLTTSNNSVRTTADSGVPVVANTWINLGAVVNAAGTSAQFFVDGTSVGTITTNIPTVAGRESGPLLKIQKALGTTSSIVYLDYFAMEYAPTTAR